MGDDRAAVCRRDVGPVYWDQLDRLSRSATCDHHSSAELNAGPHCLPGQSLRAANRERRATTRRSKQRCVAQPLNAGGQSSHGSFSVFL